MSKRSNAKKQQTIFGYFKVQDKETAQSIQKQTPCPVSNDLEMLSVNEVEYEEYARKGT